MKDIRIIINKYINFSFIYLDNNNEIYDLPKSLINLGDILNGKLKKNTENISNNGEMNIGKSTCIDSSLNHLKKVVIDENFKYVLFEEKKCN